MAAIVASGAMLGCASTPAKSNADRVSALLSRTPLIDGHNDLLIHYLGPANSLGNVDQYDIRKRTTGQVDLPRMKAGHVGAAIFTVGINDPKNREVAIAASTSLLRELAKRSSNDFEVVTDGAGVTRAFKSGRIAALMGLEGGDQIWDAANPPPVVKVGDVADHVEHVRRVAGVDHVGIGADFDGVDFSRVTGLDDVSKFPALFVELMNRGWTDEDLEKLAGKNFLRVLKAVEATAGR
ncbi:MAG: membrane dipeptidase [Gemmatimonadaceae bacterium]